MLSSGQSLPWTGAPEFIWSASCLRPQSATPVKVIFFLGASSHLDRRGWEDADFAAQGLDGLLPAALVVIIQDAVGVGPTPDGPWDEVGGQKAELPGRGIRERKRRALLSQRHFREQCTMVRTHFS